MITIIDYNTGNIGSIKNILKKIGVDSRITNKKEDIKKATKLILPGVGSFDTGMKNLKKNNLVELLNEKVLSEKIHILGICLGAQLMTNKSEEGKEKGLGWFDADTKKFDLKNISGRWPLPNIGWRDIQINMNLKSNLLSGLNKNPRFYFVHSYYISCKNKDNISMRSEYGHPFTCGLQRDNIYCVQFHPEKSHRFGMKLFQNFADL